MINRLRTLACLVPLLLTACSAQVIGGGSSGQLGGGDGGSGSGGPAQIAVAMTRAQSDVLWEEYWATHGGGSGSSSSGGSGGLNPSDLFLRVSDLGATCASPTTDIGCGGHWNLTLVLPPALQQVGSYDLDDPTLVQYSSMSETGQANSSTPGDCSWGGGSTGPGTLEILALDASEVHFRLTMTDGIWESDPSGEYTAPRCP